MDQIAVIPWEIVQGTTGIFGPIVWQTGAPLSLVNLTGCTGVCNVRTSPVDPILVSVSTTPTVAGQVILGGVAGTVEVILAPTTTMLLPAGNTGDVTNIWGQSLIYEILITFATGQVWPFSRAALRVKSAV